MDAIDLSAYDAERSPVIVTLKGEPVAKGRARVSRFGGVYTPKKTATYEAAFKAAASEVMRDRAPLEGPLRMDLIIILSIPMSWSRKQQALALGGERWPIGRPDLDNVEKAATDALNHVVFRDDSLICEKFSRKRYGREPQVTVTVSPL